MKTTIYNKGNKYFIQGDVGIVSKLPNKVLTFQYQVTNNGVETWLEEASPIKLPPKIYSNDSAFIKHVLATYKNYNHSLGVLLSGRRGLGKSFTASVICNSLDLPVVRILNKIPSQVPLFPLLGKIQQEHIVFIDEFEKIFKDENERNMDFINQTDFLTYLDNGSLTTKRLFLITTNEDVIHYMRNRPSRIRYLRKYEKLEKEIIEEIVDDLLVNADHREDLINNVPSSAVNIDVLVKIIEEINLHDKPYSNFKDFFNFHYTIDCTFEITEVGGDGIGTVVLDIDGSSMDDIIAKDKELYLENGVRIVIDTVEYIFDIECRFSAYIYPSEEQVRKVSRAKKRKAKQKAKHSESVRTTSPTPFVVAGNGLSVNYDDDDSVEDIFDEFSSDAEPKFSGFTPQQEARKATLLMRKRSGFLMSHRHDV